MTFAALENSQASGSPVDLYEFHYGDELLCNYCNSDTDTTVNSITYVAVTVSKTSIVNTQDSHKVSVTITLKIDNPVVEKFKFWMDDRVHVTIKRTHRGDSDVWHLFKGRVITVNLQGSYVELTCESSLSAMSRAGLTKRYSLGCPHTLYDEYTCKVLISTYRELGTVESITGNDVLVSGISMDYAVPYFVGGLSQTSLTAPIQSRTITAHVRDSATSVLLTLSSIPVGLTIGSDLFVSPGCQKTQADCKLKFANNFNFGGIPLLPTRNPYTTPVNMPPEV